MAVQIWRRHRSPQTDTPQDPAAHDPAARGPALRPWRRGTPPPAGPAPAVPDRPSPGRHLRGRHRPVSNMIMGTAWAAVAILTLGILLTLTDANTANTLVHRTLETAAWLATPFDDVFPNPDQERHRYLNWGLTAVVYLLLGRILSRIIRF